MTKLVPGRNYFWRRMIWPVIAVGIIIYVTVHMPLRALLGSLGTLAEIVIEVGLTCFLGAILEYRSWLRFVSFLAAPLIGFARLPSVCASAFMSAMVSGSAAGMMLAEQCRAGKIPRREMIFAGLSNATPSMISFSLGMTLPVIGAIGLAGAIYYGITYSLAVVLMLGFLLAARLTAGTASVGPAMAMVHPPAEDWNSALRKSCRRTGGLLWRVLLVTAPLYLLTACAIRQGFFEFGKNAIPSGLEKWLTPETLTILASRMGGMLSASGIAAELLQQHKVSVIQVVLIMLLGNVINNPFRTMRRSLPVALGIYPGYDGAIIAITLMVARLLATGLTVTAIILLFN